MKTLLLVHAHPDDEAISTGILMMLAAEAGDRVVLVTCTRGEEGEIHNRPEGEALRPRLAEVRTEELAAAGRILGVADQRFLGYRDSGMAGTPANDAAGSFHTASLDEAAERLAAIMREVCPDVVVTYASDGIYGHPDHVRAHEVTMAAALLLEPPAPAIWWVVIPQQYIDEYSARLAAEGLPNPFDAVGIKGWPAERISRIVESRDLVTRKRSAFAAHVTQNAPSSFFMNMPEAQFAESFSREYFVHAGIGSADPLPGIMVPAPPAGDGTSLK